jgi:hypothetical protein
MVLESHDSSEVDGRIIFNFKVIIHVGPSHYYNYEIETHQCELFCILYNSVLRKDNIKIDSTDIWYVVWSGT